MLLLSGTAADTDFSRSLNLQSRNAKNMTETVLLIIFCRVQLLLFQKACLQISHKDNWI